METFHQFISKYPRKVFRKGETILLKNVDPKAVYVIESGLVKTYTITSYGTEHLVSIESRNEDFPVGYAFGFTQKAPYFYQAFNRCVIRYIPRQDYVDYIHSNISALQERHARLTMLLMTTMSRIDTLEQAHARDKIVHTFLYMAERFGLMLKPYRRKLRLQITQQDIANLLGISRETTNFEIKKLESLKLLSHTRQNYTLDLERLKEFRSDEPR